jgi:phosphohistidine phosphatase SixA
VDIVLVRHGNRDKADRNLTVRGEHQIDCLVGALRARGVQPSVILSSDRPYAIQTRDRLAQLAGPRGALINVSEPLNPDPGNPGGIEAVLAAAEAKGVPLGDDDTLVLVGHEGRLSGLLVELTSQRSRPLERGGAVAVHGPDLASLLKGAGQVAFRYPVVDHQEAELRSKVKSKMTVATFLAGFVFAALVEIVLGGDFPPWRQVATIILTLALALFVAAIYIYDELSMPEGFWQSGMRTAPRRWLSHRRERHANERWRRIAEGQVDLASLSAPSGFVNRLRHQAGLSEDARRQELTALEADLKWFPIDEQRNRALADEDAAQARQDGPLYIYMVRTWNRIFTPAVVLALTGFGIVVFERGTLLTGLGFLAAVAVALGWLVWQRPPSATD